MNSITLKLLLLMFCLFSSNSKAEEADLSLTNHPELALELFQDQLLTAINLSFSHYVKERNSIALRFKRQYPDNYTYWLRLLDFKFKQKYFFELAKYIRATKIEHANEYADHLEKTLTDGPDLNIQWMDQLMYRKYGRGAFDSVDNTLFLQIATFSEIVTPVIHEITHALDEDLFIARFKLDQIKREDNIAYIFYKNLYLPYYKELLPRLRSCQFFTALRSLRPKEVFSAEDERIFEQVLNAKSNCHQWVYDSFSPHRILDYYWFPGEAERLALEDYELSWLAKHGFNKSFGRKRN